VFEINVFQHHWSILDYQVYTVRVKTHTLLDFIRNPTQQRRLDKDK